MRLRRGPIRYISDDFLSHCDILKNSRLKVTAFDSIGIVTMSDEQMTRGSIKMSCCTNLGMIFKLLVTLTLIFKSVCDSHLVFCEYPTLKMPMISVKQ